MNLPADPLAHPAVAVAGRIGLFALRAYWWFLKTCFWVVACLIGGIMWGIFTQPNR